jgi:hypothetical protein
MTQFEKIKNMDIDDMAIYHTLLIYDHLKGLVKELGITPVEPTKEEMKAAIAEWKKLLEREV